jgi:hypothetical protein
MNYLRYIFLVIGTLALPFCLVYLAHQMGKLPNEPEWASPAEMFSNFGFIVGFGLGLPYPKLASGLILLFITWGCFMISRRIIFGRRKKAAGPSL